MVLLMPPRAGTDPPDLGVYLRRWSHDRSRYIFILSSKSETYCGDDLAYTPFYRQFESVWCGSIRQKAYEI